jgi:hypothetical protein
MGGGGSRLSLAATSRRPGHARLFAAPGSDVVRQPRSIRHAFTEGVRSRIDTLRDLIPGRSTVARRQNAVAAMAALVGAAGILILEAPRQRHQRRPEVKVHDVSQTGARDVGAGDSGMRRVRVVDPPRENAEEIAQNHRQR